MPKLLWISQFNLHDSSSGAAKHCKALLEQLAKRGVNILAIGGFVFDSIAGAKSTFPKLEAEVQQDAAKKPPIALEQNGINYLYIPTSTTSLSLLPHDEKWRIYTAFCRQLNIFRPDVCMGYGMALFGTAVHAECKRRGIPHAYPICNGNHPYYNFWDSDLLFTDSAANAQLYAQRDHLNLATTGAFIDKDAYIADSGSHEYITMINPEPRKGGSIFAKLALLAKNDPELKNEKFLVVNSRGNFASTVSILHDGDDKEATNYKPEMFDNVRMTQNTTNMKAIYALTKVLLAPSVPKAWYEGWGRVASEAVLNRIPVLVAKNGGLEEAMAGAGIALDVPSTLHDDPARMPSDEEIAPWLEALKQLLKAKIPETPVIASEAKQSHSKFRHSGNSSLRGVSETNDEAIPLKIPPVIAREQSKGSNLTKEPKQFTFDEWRTAESSEWQARFDEAARLLDIERSTDRTMAMLEPLFAKRASQNPHIMLKGQLRFGFDGNPY
ncbi:MAG: hypothetical protein MR878_04980 [Campylobacter sp.]|uniref:hypothetical protein n=1 Tax=Campylobacter sp. TaxID=205 RepID=UPI002AA8F2D6|nr:hypothetical protein [Campylobacter sp.]MCI7014722.1 hypothetical protein [Campylobacter sp.]